MYPITIVLAAGWVFLSGCSSSKNTPVAHVGSHIITREHIEDQASLNRLESPGMTLDQALNQLIDLYTRVEILKKHNHSITSEIIEKEADRIDHETRWPERLKQFKELFGNRRSAYLNHVVLPAYVSRTLYSDLFLNSPNIQKKSFLKAQAILSELQKKPSQAEEIAARELASIATVRIIEKNKELHFDLLTPPLQGRISKFSPSPQPSATQKKWLLQVIHSKTPGSVYPEIISEGTLWQIARYLGNTTYPQKGKVHQIQILSISKQSFENWYDVEKESVSIKRLVSHLQ